ncbi:unnamed protein product, partial [marine sediment metagenome]
DAVADESSRWPAGQRTFVKSNDGLYDEWYTIDSTNWNGIEQRIYMAEDDAFVGQAGAGVITLQPAKLLTKFTSSQPVDYLAAAEILPVISAAFPRSTPFAGSQNVWAWSATLWRVLANGGNLTEVLEIIPADLLLGTFTNMQVKWTMLVRQMIGGSTDLEFVSVTGGVWSVVEFISLPTAPEAIKQFLITYPGTPDGIGVRVTTPGALGSTNIDVLAISARQGVIPAVGGVVNPTDPVMWRGWNRTVWYLADSELPNRQVSGANALHVRSQPADI